MINLVFLDIDGVLNSVASATRYRTDKRFGDENVAAFNRIIDQTSARIVISSTWRFGRTDAELGHVLRQQGVHGEIVGSTDRDFEGEGCPRGSLIQRWLDAQTEKPDRFIILDDNADMRPLRDRLVQTDSKVGLTDADADKAILMLKGVTW